MSFFYKILIEYDGTNFVGWQKQKNGNSIQEIIEKVLEKILKEKILIYGAGRTDAGVHAIAQAAHFKLNNEIINSIKFLKSANYFLNKNLISILEVKKINKNFHARFSAKKKIYEYIIINRIAPLSLEKDRAWLVPTKLDFEILKKGSKLLIGTKDFSTFRSSSCGAISPIKTINFAGVVKKKEKIFFTFISRSFLQNQIRSMVGCLKELGEKKLTLKEFKSIINSKQRSMCSKPAPAYGLYLKKIFY